MRGKGGDSKKNGESGWREKGRGRKGLGREGGEERESKAVNIFH